MAQITIEIPDELSQKLAPFRDQLSELFTQFVSVRLQTEKRTGRTTQEPLFPETHREVLDFLMSQPNPQKIVNFKVSEQSQARLQVLLQKNRESSLSIEEESELDIYEQLENLMGLLKARAFAELSPALQAEAIKS